VSQIGFHFRKPVSATRLEDNILRERQYWTGATWSSFLSKPSSELSNKCLWKRFDLYQRIKR